MVRFLLRYVFPIFTVLGLINLIDIAHAETTTLHIVTGAESGTFFKVASNISDMLKEKNSDYKLEVMPSRGSMDNLYSVTTVQDVELGIVQADVLDIAERESNVGKTKKQRDDAKRFVDLVRYVAPLYDAEVHLLVKKDIKSLEQLKGKRVAVGELGSGSRLTAIRIFSLANLSLRNIKTEQMSDNAVMLEYLSAKDALPVLKNGDIDGILYSVRSPAPIFVENDIDASKFYLLPIDHKGIRGSDYKQVTIPANTYKWQAQAVSTVSVSTLLISADFKNQTKCKAVGKLARFIYDNLTSLQKSKHSHSSWKEVKLDDFSSVKKWRQQRCVVEELKQIPKSKGKDILNPLESAVDREFEENHED